MKALGSTSLIILASTIGFSVIAQVNVTTYGIGVPTKHTTITPTYSGYQATTYGVGQPTTYSTITVPNNQGWQSLGSQGLQADRQHGITVPPNLVTRPEPLDFSASQNAFQNGYQNAANAQRQREAAENLRKQNKLLEQRTRFEAEQNEADREVRRQTREAEIAEAKLRKEMAEAQLGELKAKQAQKKAEEDAAEKIRRQEAQARFDRITDQVNKEAAETEARRKARAQSGGLKVNQ